MWQPLFHSNISYLELVSLREHLWRQEGRESLLFILMHTFGAEIPSNTCICIRVCVYTCRCIHETFLKFNHLAFFFHIRNIFSTVSIISGVV